MFQHCLSKNNISIKSVYISIKSVSKAYIIEHYQFSRTKKTDLSVKTWGGGIKDMLSPPCQNMGGIHHPHPPGIYALGHRTLYVMHCWLSNLNKLNLLS